MGEGKSTAGGGDSSRSEEAAFDAGWLRAVTEEAESGASASGMARAERELAKLRALFRTVFSQAPIGMAIVDASGKVVIANDALCRVTDHTHHELTERTIADMLVPEDRLLEATNASASLPGRRSPMRRRCGCDGRTGPRVASPSVANSSAVPTAPRTSSRSERLFDRRVVSSGNMCSER